MRNTTQRLLPELPWHPLLLLLVVCVPLVGLTLRTMSEERRRLVREWKQCPKEMMQLNSREEEQVIGQSRQPLLALAESTPVRTGNERDSQNLLEDL